MARELRDRWIAAALVVAVGCGGDDVVGEGESAGTTGSTTAVATTSGTSGTSGESTSAGTQTGSASETGETTGVVAECGDGVVEGDEACDDGDADNTDACLDTCVAARCGDGYVGPGEACDDGNQVDDDACSNSCALASCGDGVVQGAEACDDGNADDTDACLSTCVAASCGDGFVWAGVEACDDGDDDDTDDCPATCQPASCGDGYVWADNEACDGGGESAACDDDCTPAACGDGKVNASAGEACDDGDDDDTDACVAGCVAASCGDGFLWAGVEACDDGNLEPGDGCDAACEVEACVWDVDDLPLPISVHADNYYGQIAFDADCDLLVAGAFSKRLYRVDRTDGSVATIAEIDQSSINGLVYRPSDGLIYATTVSQHRLYAADGVGGVTEVLELPAITNALAVAPEGFGDYGGQLVAALETSAIVAIDPGTKSITTIGASTGILSDLVFAPDGALYVANYTADRIDSVSAEGTFTPLFTGIEKPDGIAIDGDGSRLFVAYLGQGGSIGQVSLPGAVLTPGPVVSLDAGYYISGLLVDGADNVLYKSSNGGAVIDAFKAP
ncbi:MAG: DUF4215 domain-containing protein [Nannocystaceae bacterium]